MFEPKDIARFERETRAMIRRAGADDPDAFAQIVAIVDSLPAELVKAAAELVAPTEPTPAGLVQRFAWAQIGQALGVTRSAAYQRFGPRASARRQA